MRIKKILLSILLSVLIITSAIPVAAKEVSGNNWMSEISDNASLVALNIPGSHNAGAIYVSSFLQSLAQTQDQSIENQLKAGVRLLDIRIARDKSSNELMIVHGVVNTYTNKYNGSKLKLSNVISSIEKFLKDNPTETVILSYQAEDGLLDSTSSSFSSLVNQLIKTFNDDPNKTVINKGDKSPVLGDVRGKIILLSSDVYQKVEDHFESTASQKWNYLKPYFDSSVKQNYSKDYNFTKGLGENSMPKVLYASCTNGTGLSTNPKKAANQINPKLLSYDFKEGTYYGWVYMDFVNGSLAKKIYDANIKQAEAHVHSYVLEKDSEKHYEKCSCGDIRNSNIHTFNNGITTVLPTCIKEGVKTVSCIECGYSKNITLKVDPDNHQGKTEVRNSSTPSCNKEGYSGDTYCLDCNKIIVNGSTINKTDSHVYNNGVVLTPSTCVSKGVIEYTCGICGNKKTDSIAIDKTNHTAKTSTINAASPTCTENGYTGDIICDDCKSVLTAGKVINAIGHKYGEYTSDEENHTRVCLNNTNHIETEKHEFENYICKKCGYDTTPADKDDYIKVANLTNEEVYNGSYFIKSGDSYIPLKVTKNSETKTTYLGDDGKYYDESEISYTWTAKNGRTYNAASPFVRDSLKTYTRTHKTTLFVTRYWYVNDSNPADTSSNSTSANGARNNLKANEFRSDGAPDKGANADDPYYVAASYTKVTVVTSNNYIYKYDINGSITESRGSGVYCPFDVYKLDDGKDYHSGTFKVASLNVDGLPNKILGITINGDGPGATGTRALSKALSTKDWDFFAVSEDFNYHNDLMSSLVNYKSGTNRGGISGLKNDTDGLNLIYKNSISVTNEKWTAWNDSYSTGFANTGNGADGMIDKGYRFYQVTVNNEATIDVYILHMDADSDEGDILARESQIRQLVAAIKNSNNNNPIIVMGDTNCRYTREHLKTLLIDSINSDERYEVHDPWVDLAWNGVYPTYGTDSIMAVDKGGPYPYPKAEIVDKMFYINNSKASVKLVASTYTVDDTLIDDSGKPFADHWPIVTEFKYTVSK